MCHGVGLAIPVASLFDFLTCLERPSGDRHLDPTDLSVLKAFHRLQAGGPDGEPFIAWFCRNPLVLWLTPPEWEEPSAVDPFLLWGLPMAHRVGETHHRGCLCHEPLFPSFWLGILLLVGSACLIAVACWFPRKAPGDNPSTS